MATKQLTQGTAPIRDTASVNAQNRIPTRFDKRTLSQNEVTANELELFQPDPERGLRKNYRDNPFQGNEPKKVVGIGLYVSPTLIRTDSDNGIEAVHILQTLENSAVTLGKGDREEILHRMHTIQVSNLHNADVIRGGDGSGNTVEMVHFGMEPGKVLHEPDLVLTGDERFHFTLHLDDGFKLPTAQNYADSSEAEIRVTGLVQYERLQA